MPSAEMFYSLVVQMARMIPNQLQRHKDTLARRRRRNRDEVAFGPPGGRCGCCPACRAFVYVEFPGPAGVAPCPRCGRAIRSLDPPGVDEPSGVWDRQMDG